MKWEKNCHPTVAGAIFWALLKHQHKEIRIQKTAESHRVVLFRKSTGKLVKKRPETRLKTDKSRCITLCFNSLLLPLIYFFLFNLGNGTAILELLLNAGADLNAITAWGDTAAHYAALTGKTLAKPFSSCIAVFIPP